MAHSKVYSYIRFSSAEQAKGDSVRRQEELIKNYCRRNGIDLGGVETICDIGVSAFHGQNSKVGEFADFLGKVRKGKIEKGAVLLVENLDRLSREELGDSQALFREILDGGITVVQLSPEKEYTKESVRRLSGLIEPLLQMSRAYEESALKSERLAKAWNNKRDKILTKKLTKRAPSWLILRSDGADFDVRPESKKIVEDIFRWAASGVGVGTITKRLNAANIHNFGNRSKTGWHASYVRKILKSRAVLGEFRLHAMKDRKRCPIGDIIPNYFPRIINDELFYAAANGLASRLQEKGPRGKGVANLFTGLIFCAVTGTSMTIVNKGKKSKGKKLVSYGATRGLPGSVYRSIELDRFEEAILTAMAELNASDFDGSKGQDEIRIGQLNETIEGLKQMIERTQRDIDASPTIFESVLVVLKNLETKKNAAVDERNALLGSVAVKRNKLVDESKSLIEMLAKSDDNDREQLREKLKAMIRQIVESIWVVTHGPSGQGVVEAQIYYRNGNYRQIGIYEIEDSLSWSGDQYKDAAHDFRTEYRYPNPPRILPSMPLANDYYEGREPHEYDLRDDGTQDAGTWRPVIDEECRPHRPWRATKP